MPKPKTLSGKDLVSIFQKYGFELDKQRGSHIKLKRMVGDLKQIITLPNHKEIDTGTVVGIFRQASRFISEEELRKDFYTR